MIEIKGMLKIELRSDLCVASGNSFAGIVDQEIVHNEYGFPYIPARRLKGCLREAAEMLESDSLDAVEALFGFRGQGESGRIFLHDAKLSFAKGLQDKIDVAVKTQTGPGKYLIADEILRLYTSLRTQTRINRETGTAEENTLRVTRVVNQYDPLNTEIPLCFEGELICLANDEEEEKTFKSILKNAALATRNIGMNRNSGLGSVRCEIIFETRVPDDDDNCSVHLEFKNGKLTYCLENQTPLVLSEEDKSDTASYISGKSILGILAGTYLKNHTADDIFEKLFLTGKVCYTNANLMISGKRGFPAPKYLYRVKKTEEFVNLLAKSEQSESEQTKKLKTWYVSLENQGEKNTYHFAEPQRELVYHHRRAHAVTDMKDQLYSMEVLSKGQQFVGEIYTTDDKLQGKIIELLRKADFRVGKSRSAQYGHCVLKDYQTEEAIPAITYKKGEKIAVTLKSDGIFIDKDHYTVQFEDVKKLLAVSLGLKYDEAEEEWLSIVSAKEVTGYNTLWKMKRPSVPAISAGSTFVYTLTEAFTPSERFAGERNLEGFGEVLIQPLDKMVYQAGKESEAVDPKPEEALPLSDELQEMLGKILKPHVVRCLVSYEAAEGKKCGLDSAQLGRITLMLKESVKQTKTLDEAANELYNRVNSIKRKEVKEHALKLLEDLTVKQKEVKEHTLKELEALDDYYVEIDTEKILKRLKDYKELSHAIDCLNEETRNEMLKKAWIEYMLQRLALLSYQKRGEGKDD